MLTAARTQMERLQLPEEHIQLGQSEEGDPAPEGASRKILNRHRRASSKMWRVGRSSGMLAIVQAIDGVISVVKNVQERNFTEYAMGPLASQKEIKKASVRAKKRRIADLDNEVAEQEAIDIAALVSDGYVVEG